MKTYLENLKQILETGQVRNDRTGVGVISIFGLQSRYDLQQGFPAVTTKKLAWKACVAELLWFIEGSGDERRLAEITHGTRDGVTTIWTPNALSPYWKAKAKFEGDLGRVYGVQWRHWRRPNGTEVDQLQDLIDQIRSDPTSRRHILTAWNPGELDDMALPPCHVMSQFYVSDGRLSCQLYQRSGDFPLGIPFNIASYSLLTHMIAQVCGLGVGEFVHVVGDAHIYLNQVDGVREQLTREPLPLPTLWLNPEVTDITRFTVDDIKLLDYQSHSALKIPMAV
jgi:thymidylate synthase